MANKVNEEKFECEECGLKFRTQYAFNQHILTHRLWFKSSKKGNQRV